MRNKSVFVTAAFVTFCIIINYFGKLTCEHFQLPFWFDSFGTVLTAYVLGPICGAIVGASCNIIYGIVYSKFYYAYGIVSIMIGIVTGIAFKKGALDSIFRVLSLSFFVAIFSLIGSTPFNYLFFDGMIGNVWGDAVSIFLQNFGIKELFAHLIGQFYLEFLDKVLTLFFLFITVKMYQNYKKYRRKKELEKIRREKRNSFANPSIFLLFVILSFNSANKLNAFEPELKPFDSYVPTIYNNSNGLFGGIANDIEQTQEGTLWIGTYNGLYRYSGSSFQSLNQFSNIKNVNCLYTDESGRLWIGTNDSGITISIDDTVSNVLTSEQGLPSDSIRCITQDSNGLFYVGTSSVLSLVSITGGLSVIQTIPEITYASSISADTNGHVATVANNGTLYLLKNKEVIYKTDSSTDSRYTCCSFSPDGKLFAGTTKNQIEILEVSENKLKKIQTISCSKLQTLKSIKFTNSEYTFICADNGVGYFDKQNNFSLLNTNSFNSSIDHMIMDYQGNLWFTSSRLGLLKLSESIFSEIYTNDFVNEGVINSVTVWNDFFYIGKDNGLTVISEDGAELFNSLTDLLKDTRIRCLFVDSKNQLWITTSGKGIFQAKSDGTIKNFSEKDGTSGSRFRNVIETKDKTIVVSGDSGITFIKDNKVINTLSKADGMENPKTLCVAEQDDGSILAGTDGNGIYVIQNGKIVRSYKKQDGLPSEVILRIIKDSTTSNYFIVTSNSLCYLSNEKINVLNNFPYNNNYDVVISEKGMIFVLSSAGIFVADKGRLLNKQKFDYELFNSKNGLNHSITANAWNYLDKNKNLYISTDTSVVCLNIDNYDYSTHSYRSMLKSITADDKIYPVERGEVTYLPRNTHRVEITPEVINFSLNDPFVKIWLEGFENNPKVMLQSELSTITYTNLPAGDYTFHLAVLDSKGNKVIAESQYPIFKEREFYENWWFILYFILVFSIAIIYLTWLFFRTQIQKTIENQKRELEFARKQVEMGNETILTIAQAVDARDENTSHHSVRVAEYSVLIAKELNYTENQLEDLLRTALLHDIGKIGIPDSILNKPSRLTDEEYFVMKTHVTKGAEILRHFTLLENVAEGALYHHERYDGNGYAHGLKGEQIPLNARIIGLADAFDAMTANRVYRKQLDLDFVLQEIKRCSGTQFDPNLVEILLRLIDNKTINVEQIYGSKNDIAGELI